MRSKPGLTNFLPCATGGYIDKKVALAEPHYRAITCGRSAIGWGVTLIHDAKNRQRAHTPTASWSDQKSHGVKVVEINPVRFQPRWYHRPTEYVYPRSLLLTILFTARFQNMPLKREIELNTTGPPRQHHLNCKYLVNRRGRLGECSSIREDYGSRSLRGRSAPGASRSDRQNHHILR